MMLQKLFFVLFFLFSFSSSILAKDFIQGDGEFLAEEGDSTVFINRELLNSAFKDIITKSLNSLRLDSREFWDKYQEKLNSYIRKNYSGQLDEESSKMSSPSLEGPPPIPEINRKDKFDFENNFLRSGSESKNLFGVIQSYVVKSTTMSSHNPLKKYMRIQGNVNELLLKDIYNFFVKPYTTRNLSKIYLDTDYKLIGLDYSELYINSIDSFVEIINQNWKKRIDEIINNPNIEVEIIDKELSQKLKKYILSSEEFVIDSLKNAAWVTIQVKIEKINETPLLNQKELSLESNVLFYDLNTKKIVFNHPVKESIHRFSFTNDETQNVSQIASKIHRLPLNAFNDLPATISKLPEKPKKVKVNLANFKNLQDFFDLEKYLILKGSSLMLNIELDKIVKNHLVFDIYFNGEPKTIESLLLNLDQSKISAQKTILIENKNDPYSLTLKDEGNEDYRNFSLETKNSFSP